jgi:hypothetical protein
VRLDPSMLQLSHSILNTDAEQLDMPGAEKVD